MSDSQSICGTAAFDHYSVKKAINAEVLRQLLAVPPIGRD
jgi:hypothetical protein